MARLTPRCRRRGYHLALAEVRVALACLPREGVFNARRVPERDRWAVTFLDKLDFQMTNNYETSYKQKGLVVLPLPLSDVSRRLGSVEKLTLGSKRFEVTVPPNMRVGQKIRLRGLAHYIDPQLHGEDLYLLVQTPKSFIYEFHRDIHLELPLSESLFVENHVKQDRSEIIKIGNKKLEVKIPMGFQIGKKIRLTGVAKHGNGGYTGDVYLSPTIISRPTIRWRGFFDHFAKPTETKICIKFSIPAFVEVSGEWIFRKSLAEITVGNIRYTESGHKLRFYW